MMETVVLEGTGTKMAVSGYRVGGKSGTGQAAGPNGGYDGYTNSFAGVAPLDDPQIAVVVTMYRPKGRLEVLVGRGHLQRSHEQDPERLQRSAEQFEAQRVRRVHRIRTKETLVMPEALTPRAAEALLRPLEKRATALRAMLDHLHETGRGANIIGDAGAHGHRHLPGFPRGAARGPLCRRARRPLPRRPIRRSRRAGRCRGDPDRHRGRGRRLGARACRCCWPTTCARSSANSPPSSTEPTRTCPELFGADRNQRQDHHQLHDPLRAARPGPGNRPGGHHRDPRRRRRRSPASSPPPSPPAAWPDGPHAGTGRRRRRHGGLLPRAVLPARRRPALRGGRLHQPHPGPPGPARLAWRSTSTTKAALFDPERSDRAVITVDDDWGRAMAAAGHRRGLDPGHHRRPRHGRRLGGRQRRARRAWGTASSCTAPRAQVLQRGTGLPGDFNVSNAALAVLMVLASGVDPGRAAGGPGRRRPAHRRGARPHAGHRRSPGGHRRLRPQPRRPGPGPGLGALHRARLQGHRGLRGHRRARRDQAPGHGRRRRADTPTW